MTDPGLKRRALLSLGFAGVALVALAIGFQEALRRMPPAYTEAQVDSAYEVRKRQRMAELERMARDRRAQREQRMQPGSGAGAAGGAFGGAPGDRAAERLPGGAPSAPGSPAAPPPGR
jgi:hypothetical protein